MSLSAAGRYDVVVVGGAGHVGAPLSIVLASRGLRTLIYDVNEHAVGELRAGRMPFLEEGAEPLLHEALRRDLLGFAATPASIAGVPTVIVTIGTPIDEFQNPRVSVLTRCVDALIPHLTDDQLIVLRSTVAPGVTDYLASYLEAHGKRPAVAFCPERVVQGKGVEEIQALPQLVSGMSHDAVTRAAALFSKIAPEVVELSTREAEYAKLISNAWRYIQFAATNQFYMMVEADGLDYGALVAKIKHRYPRMASFPTAGFAAGPCLMKDTMQLFAHRKHGFILGQVAMTINEGLPEYLVSQLARKTTLSGRRVGILGMAFKAESDDIRDSLSYKLKKVLEFQGADVACTDEYVKDTSFLSREELVRQSDVLIVGVPHAAYRGLKPLPGQIVMDVWGVLAPPPCEAAAL
jgi:UDP-N-acetyl-D-mannosaminuronic acid dehydrogenase